MPSGLPDHWTIRYGLDRLAQMGMEKLHPDWPWINRHMVRILEEWIRPEDVGLEWGSGRSTLWFSNRVSHLISVEADMMWRKAVERQLKQLGSMDKVDLHFCPASDEGSLSGYLAPVLEVPDASLDFCLVDGNFRDHCALAAIPKLRTGGIIVVDNIERYAPSIVPGHLIRGRTLSRNPFASELWAEFIQRTEEWRRLWTTDGVSDATLWVKS